MKKKQSLPPGFADRLLCWFCKEEVLENIQGDLYEVYQKRVNALGQRRARLLYFLDVLSILRPRLIKPSRATGSLGQFAITKNHLKTAIRSIRHNALFSSINVAGLAVSMTVGIFMIVLFTELSSFDDFHEKKNRIYRVTTSRKALFQGEANLFASAPHYLADEIEAQIAGVEDVLVLDRDLKANLRTDAKGIAVKGYYASPSFFNVLSFKLKKGNPKTALENTGAIVLTESAAKKLFGDLDPINKTISIEGNPDFKTGTITGIVKDPPINSHLDFEALVSMKTIDNSLVEKRRNMRHPGHYAQSYIYLVLKDGAMTKDIETAIANIMVRHNAHAAPNTFSLQPMRDFVTKEAGLQPGPAFSNKKIELLMGLTMIVIFSACFNYTNLSLVRGLRRSKEICVRKIAGANRKHVFFQFITEAVLVSLLALAVGSGVFFLIKPELLSITNTDTAVRPMFSFNITPVQTIFFVIFALAVGFVAGFFPAFTLSKLKAGALFNDSSKVKVFTGLTVRQVLITAQIALSIGLIMCSVMAYKQYEYVLNYDLGYNTKNIVNISVQGDYIDALQNEFEKLSEVSRTSRSSVVLGTRNLVPADAMSEDQRDTIMFSCNYIDERYLPMHGFKFIAGRNFSDASITGTIPNKNIIVNEQFLKEMNLGTPEEAIGKNIWYFGEEKLAIQGVVENFVSMSLDAEAPEAFGFLNRVADENSVLGVEIACTNLLATMQKLEQLYKATDPFHPFEATFYNDQLASTYQDTKTTYTLISCLAFVAISISALGMLGMAVFTIEIKTKEISIRKVLGAAVPNLILLLSKQFLIMGTLAAIFAIPLSILTISNFILNKFIHKVEMGFMEAISGLLVVLIIGILTVGWQVRAAAIRNPADRLREV